MKQHDRDGGGEPPRVVRSATVDLDALLVALVLDPATFSRNRFFGMYRSVEVQRVRRRAALVRALVRQLGRADAGGLPPEFELTYDDSGWAQISYRVPSLGLLRRTRLAPLELSLLRHALTRLGAWEGHENMENDDDRAQIDRALRRMAPLRSSTAPPPSDRSGDDAGTGT